MSATFIPAATVEVVASYSALPRYTVRTSWSAVGSDVELDRTDGIGIACMTRESADRLVRAINDGAVYSHPELRVDVYGQTYVEARRNVYGKTLLEDLAVLGY